MAESGKNSYTYNDNEIAVSDKSVIYKIETFDKAKNSSSAESKLVKVSGSNCSRSRTRLSVNSCSGQ